MWSTIKSTMWSYVILSLLLLGSVGAQDCESSIETNNKGYALCDGDRNGCFSPACCYSSTRGTCIAVESRFNQRSFVDTAKKEMDDLQRQLNGEKNKGGEQTKLLQSTAMSYTGQGSQDVNKGARTFGGSFSGSGSSGILVLSALTGGNLFPTCPVEVPYCQRTKCGTPQDENDFLSCSRKWQCCFDFNVFLYKKLFGRKFMGYTPTCHHGATSSLYGKIRSLFPSDLSVFLLGKPIKRMFKSAFDSKFLNLNNHLACTIQNILGPIQQRSAGWKSITKVECALRAYCWDDKKKTCNYPSPTAMQFAGASDVYPELYSYDGTAGRCPNPYSLQTEAYKRLPCRHEFPDFSNIAELLTWCPKDYCCDNVLAGTSSFATISTLSGGCGGGGGSSGGIGSLLGLSGLLNGGGSNALLASGLFGGFGGGTGGSRTGKCEKPNSLAQALLLTGNKEKIIDIYCPYFFLKILDLPDISKNTKDCCIIPICSHKKLGSNVRPPSRQTRLTDWSWGSCNAPCGQQGSQVGSRRCVYTDNGQDATGLCGPQSLQTTQPCSGPPCITYNYGVWNQWSPCDSSCGTGSQSSTRNCNYGNQVVDASQCSAFGQALRTQSCYNGPCQQAIWGSWYPVGQCSVTCGQGNQQYQRRCTVNGQPVELSRCQDGSGNGYSSARGICTNPPCVIAQWDAWSNWLPCDSSCGVGKSARTRLCKEHGQIAAPGRCAGAPIEQQSCNNGPCLTPYPVTLYVSQWRCDCNGGTQEVRSCFRQDNAGGYAPFDDACRELGVPLSRPAQCQIPSYC